MNSNNALNEGRLLHSSIVDAKQLGKRNATFDWKNEARAALGLIAAKYNAL